MFSAGTSRPDGADTFGLVVLWLACNSLQNNSEALQRTSNNTAIEFQQLQEAETLGCACNV
jgi:hypothetical protein